MQRAIGCRQRRRSVIGPNVVIENSRMRCAPTCSGRWRLVQERCRVQDPSPRPLCATFPVQHTVPTLPEFRQPVTQTRRQQKILFRQVGSEDFHHKTLCPDSVQSVHSKLAQYSDGLPDRCGVRTAPSASSRGVLRLGRQVSAGAPTRGVFRLGSVNK